MSFLREFVAMTHIDYKSLDEMGQLSLLWALEKAEKASKKPQPESKAREVEKKIEELEPKLPHRKETRKMKLKQVELSAFSG